MKTLERQIPTTLFSGDSGCVDEHQCRVCRIWARFHLRRFESRLKGALFLLPSVISLFAGVLFAWMLPMNQHVKSRRRAAFALGPISGVTLILRILHWMYILPPFNDAIRNLNDAFVHATAVVEIDAGVVEAAS